MSSNRVLSPGIGIGASRRTIPVYLLIAFCTQTFSTHWSGDRRRRKASFPLNSLCAFNLPWISFSTTDKGLCWAMYVKMADWLHPPTHLDHLLQANACHVSCSFRLQSLTLHSQASTLAGKICKVLRRELVKFLSTVTSSHSRCMRFLCLCVWISPRNARWLWTVRRSCQWRRLLCQMTRAVGNPSVDQPLETKNQSASIST